MKQLQEFKRLEKAEWALLMAEQELENSDIPEMVQLAQELRSRRMEVLELVVRLSFEGSKL